MVDRRVRVVEEVEHPGGAGGGVRRDVEVGIAVVVRPRGGRALVEAGEDVAEVVVEHYPALAKSELGRIAAEAESRWPLPGIILIHRHGRVKPGERLAFAAVASPDPEAALQACTFLLEALRTRAPFWRKEVLADGTTRWR